MKATPGFREHDLAGGALQKARAKALFEPLDALRDNGRREPEITRGA